MLKKILSLSLFFTLALTVFSLNIAYATSDTSIEAEVKNIIENENLVGLSWSTISNGHIESGSAGYANMSTLEPIKPDQKMHVGSVTKSVLAIGILHLISEGKLSLDSDVESLLSTLNFDNPWYHRSPIKVKNLLDHTAGLDNIRMWQFLSTKPLPNTPLKAAFSSNSRNLLKIRTEPGTQYSYSNMGYTLLGMVIEAVTHQPYEKYLDDNLLGPLAMHDSSFEFISQQGQFADVSLAMGYHENNVAQIAVASYLRPAGQFTTTALDMAKFMIFLLGDGKINGKIFVNYKYMKMLNQPLDTKAQIAGLTIGHGLAFANRDRHHVISMCHPGTTFGFRAYVCLFPEEKKGFFYSTNTDSETADYEKLNKLFINGLNVSLAPIVKPTDKQGELSALHGIYLPSPNNMVEFEFIDMLFNFIWLTQSNEQLLIKSLQNTDRRLVQIDEGLFRDVNRTQASHVIYTEDENRLFISDGLKTFEKNSGITLLFYWLSLLLGLLALFYVFIVALIRIAKRDKDGFGRIKWAFINMTLFSLPVYFYMNQSFLQFGDITVASICLAYLSGLLPLTLLFSLWASVWEYLKGKSHGKFIILDIISLIMSVQFCLVLIAWGQLPIIFWQ